MNNCNDEDEKFMEQEAKEEIKDELKDEQKTFDKFYDMLTEEEKFDLAENDFLDDGPDINWYLGPKLIVESRRRKEAKNNEQ